MLVLKRNPDQNIQMRNRHTGEIITIGVVYVRGKSVGVGIDAPQEWDVVREVLEREPRPSLPTTPAALPPC